MATQSLRNGLSLLVAAGIGGLIVSATEGPRRSVAAPVAPAAADGTLGTALLSAVVGSDGSFVRGNGVKSTARLDTGQYRITFDRNVANCTFSATVGGVNNSGIISLGYAVAGGSPDGPDSVVVYVRNFDGSAPGNNAHHLLVFCSK